jgi:hypothetical protein
MRIESDVRSGKKRAPRLLTQTHETIPVHQFDPDPASVRNRIRGERTRRYDNHSPSLLDLVRTHQFLNDRTADMVVPRKQFAFHDRLILAALQTNIKSTITHRRRDLGIPSKTSEQSFGEEKKESARLFPSGWLNISRRPTENATSRSPFSQQTLIRVHSYRIIPNSLPH